MKIVFYGLAAYLLAVGVSGYISNSATQSPTADSFAALPSVGTFLGANQPTTEAGINIASGLGFFVLAYLNVV